MAYNFEEQDQIDRLKAFFSRYGSLILMLITAIALTTAGYRLWGWYQQKQAADASTAYQALQKAAGESNLSGVRVAAQSLREAHGSSAYAAMGALVSAKAHFDAGETEAAAAALQWVIDNAADSEFAPIARVRLAGLLLDQGKAEAGLPLLDKSRIPQAYQALADDRRGDLLASLGRKDEALAAWDAALGGLSANSPLRRPVQLKRDALAAGA